MAKEIQNIPYNADAEKSVLASIILDNDVLNDVGDLLKDTDFYDHKNQTVFASMLELHAVNQPIDILTLTDYLSTNGKIKEVGGSNYVVTLTNEVPSSAHALAYAKIVKENSIRRQLIKTSSEIVKKGSDYGKDVAELIDDVQKDIFALSEKNTKGDLTPISTVINDNFDRLDELFKSPDKVRGVPTGYRDVDDMLSGFQKSDLLILAARPAMGKSTLAMNIAHNIALKQKLPVLVFSLEMSKEQLVDRMLAEEANINAWSLRSGKITDDELARLGAAMGRLSEAPIYIDDSPGATIMDIRTKARRIARREPIGLIIIDYLQLMTGTNRKSSENRVQEISEISRGLKMLARELDVPVLALSQLSRSVENRNDKRPQLSDLRESGSIEQDADVVMFVYRDDYYNPETRKQHITELLIKKHRNGATGTVELYFHPERVRFMSLQRDI